MGNNYIIPSLDRALEIIGFLAKQPKGCGITVIADKLGYPKNSVFRILKTLSAKGYIIETDQAVSAFRQISCHRLFRGG